MRGRQGGDGHFSMTPSASIPRSTFNRSHGHKTIFGAGDLVPFYVDEVLPGDTFRVQANMFARMATPILPLMDNLYLDMWFFFVPNRLIWDNWQKFCGEQLNPGDSTDFLVPVVKVSDALIPVPDYGAHAALYDYFGVPVDWTGPGTKEITVTNLFGRGYNLIFNEWFRDQNLVNRAVVDKDDGPDNAVDYKIRQHSKKHDYFTSCLPWPQKGPGVDIPIAGIPVVGTTSPPPYPSFSSTGTGLTELKFGASGANAAVQAVNAPGANVMGWVDPRLQIGQPLSGEAAGTINALREAVQIQRLLERDARGGTRYVELLKSHFGVTSPDARLQRPEYLGGGMIPVVINPVPQTSASGAYADTPQGHMAAFGTLGGRNGFVKSFVEHGIVIGICCIRADITYQQGLNKMFFRRTKYDYYWPALSNLGEQAVLNKEIYCGADGVVENEDVFGYQERWAEYRYLPSRTSYAMRSTHPTPLDAFHLAEEFSALPTLSEAFLYSRPPVDRVVAVTGAQQFYLDCWINVNAARPMPVYSVPGMMDHF